MNHPLLDALCVQLASRRRSTRTVETYVTLASAFLNSVGGEEPTRRDVEAFLARPRATGERRAASSVNQSLSALRALARAAVVAGAWTRDPTSEIGMLREPIREPRFLSRDELSTVFRTAASNPNDIARTRELALVAVLATTALRVHEVVALDVDQLELDTSTLRDVRGKGDTRHHVALSRSALALLVGWLPHRASCTSAAEQALFVSDGGRRWSVRAVQRHVSALGKRAGLNKSISPHALRHTVATLGLAMGVDVVTLADVMRHESLSTTRRYIRMGTERKRSAADVLDRLVPADVLPLTDSRQSGDIHNAPTLDTNQHFDDALVPIDELRGEMSIVSREGGGTVVDSVPSSSKSTEPSR